MWWTKREQEKLKKINIHGDDPQIIFSPVFCSLLIFDNQIDFIQMEKYDSPLIFGDMLIKIGNLNGIEDESALVEWFIGFKGFMACIGDSDKLNKGTKAIWLNPVKFK